MIVSVTWNIMQNEMLQIQLLNMINMCKLYMKQYQYILPNAADNYTQDLLAAYASFCIYA